MSVASPSRLLAGAEWETAVQELVDFVIEQTETPVDAWAVTAILESNGMRDLDAAERFGKADVFDLAEELYYRCRGVQALAPAPPEPTRSEPLGRRLRKAAEHTFRGGFFFIPMAIQLAVLLAAGWSLWAGLDFGERQASIVASAMLASLAITGGFIQALGYVGLGFLEGDRPGPALRATRGLAWLTLIGVAATAAGWAAIGLISGEFPGRDLDDALIYFALMCAFDFTSAVLYMAKRHLALIVSTVLGLAAVGIAHEAAGLGITHSNWIGISVAVAASGLWGDRALRRKAASSTGSSEIRRPQILALTAAPVFIYGIAYFSLILADRAIAWSAGDYVLPLRFETNYEVALDWALFSIIFALAFLEHSINAFSDRLIPTQKRLSGLNPGAHNRYFLGFYARQLLAVVVLLAVGIIAVHEGVLALEGAGAIDILSTTLHNPVTESVYLWGVGAYGLLVWGLLNGVFLFSLARPRAVLAAIVPALITSVAVGLPLSRTGEFWHSVIGLTAGCGVFALVSLVMLLRALRELDYTYYSAF